MLNIQKLRYDPHIFTIYRYDNIYTYIYSSIWYMSYVHIINRYMNMFMFFFARKGISSNFSWAGQVQIHVNSPVWGTDSIGYYLEISWAVTESGSWTILVIVSRCPVQDLRILPEEPLKRCKIHTLAAPPVNLTHIVIHEMSKVPFCLRNGNWHALNDLTTK